MYNEQTRQKTNRYRQKFATLTIRITKEQKKTLKTISEQTNTSINTICVNALKEVLGNGIQH